MKGNSKEKVYELKKYIRIELNKIIIESINELQLN